MNIQRKTLSELAQLVGGRVVGDEDVQIQRVASIELARHGDITFVAHPRYRSYLASCRASAIIVGPEIPLASLEEAGKGFLQVAQPYLAFAKILQLFTRVSVYDGQVNSQASIDSTAVLGEGVTVFPNVYVGKRVSVGRGSVLFPGVYLGEEVEVGKECVLHAQVTVRERCRIGDRVILHPGVVIGSDGFGYAGEGDERIKIPQVGAVEIEDDVEIGANTTVDRGTLGKTVIGRGTKIDNLVQIAHNVVVGEHTIIAAQTGIAGSTRIGNEVILAGQVGVLNHIEIGDKVKIGPQSGVPHSVPSGSLLSGGLAAAPHLEWLKVVTILPHLPKLWTTIRHLEQKVSHLEDVGKKGVKTHG